MAGLLVLVEALPERDDDYTPQNRKGEPRWQQEASNRFGFGIARALRHNAESDVAFYARCKRALIVSDWIAGRPINEIEAGYTSNAFVRVAHGDIRGYADGSRFLLESALRIAAIVLQRVGDENATAVLLTRLDLGLPTEALPLSALSFRPTRGEILSLYRAGYVGIATLSTLPLDILTALIGRRGNELHRPLHSEPTSAA